MIAQNKILDKSRQHFQSVLKAATPVGELSTHSRKGKTNNFSMHATERRVSFRPKHISSTCKPPQN